MSQIETRGFNKWAGKDETTQELCASAMKGARMYWSKRECSFYHVLWHIQEWAAISNTQTHLSAILLVPYYTYLIEISSRVKQEDFPAGMVRYMASNLCGLDTHNKPSSEWSFSDVLEAFREETLKVTDNDGENNFRRLDLVTRTFMAILGEGNAELRREDDRNIEEKVMPLWSVVAMSDQLYISRKCPKHS